MHVTVFLRRALATAAFGALLASAAQATTDHAVFITGPIDSGPEATKQCLECHEKQAADFMKTSHWSWSLEQTVQGRQVKRGKANAINNYCTSVSGNEVFCATCHAGYGLDNLATFDFSDPTRIDCLVCHDTTGRYVKAQGTAGMPAKSVDLLDVAQNVGKPTRDTCGACHFYGGGGDAVKHGDLDSSMAYPDRATDVHMNTDGADMQCTACHETTDHLVAGNSLGVSPGGQSHFDCTKCHAAAPHRQGRLNRHTSAVSCQTCHIPFYARNLPTKLSWDWSTAGQDLEPETDALGKPTYAKKKGTFTWGKMVVPEYAWYRDGAAGAYQAGDPIDPKKVTRLAYSTASRKDAKAKIYPFKVHRGKQIYDAKQDILVTAKTIGAGGYWKEFDWVKAATLGMEANPALSARGIRFSGEYGFAPTEMFWRLNHMVSPKEQALGCLECHGEGGRLNWKALGYRGDPMDNPEWARR